MALPFAISAPPSSLLSLANTWTAKQTFGAGISISSGQTLDWNSDLILQRDASDTLAQRRGTTAQVLRIYNTFTDLSNYERGVLNWSANTFYIGAEAAGTGTQRGVVVQGSAVIFATGGANRARVDNGVFYPLTTNAMDLGTAALNFKNLYMSSWIRFASTTVASLPAAATAGANARMMVTDATTPTFGSTVTGGGSTLTPVYSNGTNWIVG